MMGPTLPTSCGSLRPCLAAALAARLIRFRSPCWRGSSLGLTLTDAGLIASLAWSRSVCGRGTSTSLRAASSGVL